MSLALHGVTQQYGSAPPVLLGVDVTVGPDETVAVVGPSGSGKTTLVSILGGLLRPTEGQLLLDGAVVGPGGLPPGAVAWVFQTVNVLPHRTVVDNIAVGALARGASRREALAVSGATLEAVGLAQHGARRVKTLSGGEAQRVGIARALVGSPRYVLADEPTGQLDLATSRTVAGVLFDARPPGTALVVATHDLELARRCERVVSVVDGEVVPAR